MPIGILITISTSGKVGIGRKESFESILCL